MREVHLGARGGTVRRSEATAAARASGAARAARAQSAWSAADSGRWAPLATAESEVWEARMWTDLMAAAAADEARPSAAAASERETQIRDLVEILENNNG